MRQILITLALTAAAGLAACDDGGLAPPDSGARGGAGGAMASADPAAYFVGMSTSRLQACAGPPQETQVNVPSPEERWLYRAEEGGQVCRAQFTVLRGGVTHALFTDQALNPLTDLSACAPVIGSC